MKVKEIKNSLKKKMINKYFILDYGAGNILSVQRALSHCHIDSKVINSSKELEKAGYLVLPGDGSFKFASDAFRKLKNNRKDFRSC